MQVLIATRNPGKAREFREMLGGDRWQWRHLDGQDGVPTAVESGRTFLRNACIKAAHYARALGVFALADDSGLEVDALNGAPGVHSARWAEINGAGSGDAANNALLLRQLSDVPDERRTARFVCVLALADPQGRLLLTARGSVDGRIVREARGDNGFGYDPLFFVEQLGRTVAELPAETKHSISHRGRALRAMREMMRRYLPEQ